MGSLVLSLLLLTFPGEESPMALLARADSALASLPLLEAQFHQAVRNPLLGDEEEAKGQLQFSYPDRLRMVFAEPAGDLIVADGDALWLYFPSELPDQVIRRPLGEGGDWYSPFAWVRRLGAEYAGRDLGEARLDGEPMRHLRFRSSAEAYYVRVDFWLDPDWLLRQVEWEDANGVVTRYRLSKLRVEERFPEETFRFAVPEGVEVFEQ